MLRYIVLVLVFLKQCSATVYSIKERDYYRMPPLDGLDDYYRCMVDTGAQYCVVNIALFSDKPSELLQLIQKYSSDIVNFNRSEIHRGVCVNRSCKTFVDKNALGTRSALNRTLEECLNETLWNEYKLQGKLKNVEYCLQDGEETNNFDVGDIVMAVVYLVVFLVNAVGSLYDRFVSDKDGSGNRYLLAFSLSRNWARLKDQSKDPRVERLSVFHGMRAITMSGTILAHMFFMVIYSYVENPRFIEQQFHHPLAQFIQNGVVFTSTFFVMSAFMLAYSFEQLAQKEAVRWWLWPKGMLVRWIRLGPVYALVFGTIITWARHWGGGPLWRRVTGIEVADCREVWWTHALFINNYMNTQHCMPYTWYLAADTQLFAVGLLVCILARTPRAKTIILTLLFLLGLVIPAATTYWADLDAVVFTTPKALRGYDMFSAATTFRLVHIPGHANLATYTMGLAAGFFVHHWQKEGKDFNHLRKYKCVYWLGVLVSSGLVLSGGLFYIEGFRAPLCARVLYAALHKPLLQAMVVMFVVGAVFEFENVYRPVVEWKGWRVCGRVTYSAYLVHTLLLKLYTGNQVAPAYYTHYSFILLYIAVTACAYATAILIWLAVEAPVAQLLKAVMAPTRSHLENNMAAAAAAPDKGNCA